MLLIHVRTVAFLASLFTSIQCGLWIIGYILYMLAFSCGYNSKYFNSTPINFDLPTNLGSYYIWYLQGDNCTTSTDWINGIRRQSPELLVALVSIGFGLNISLLTTSIYMIVGFYSNIGRLALRLKIFSYSILVVSAWDLILVAIFSADFSPLLNKNNYMPEVFSINSTSPNILALPYFTEVFTVLILLLSRLILFWILNVFFAAYLLAKDSNEAAPSSSSPAPNTDTIQNHIKPNSLWVANKEAPVEPNKVNPGKDFFANTRFKQQIPSHATEFSLEEVSQRWISSAKQNDNFSDFREDEEEYHDIELSSVPENESRAVVESAEDEATPIDWDSDTWNREELPVIPNVKKAESNKRVTLNNKPSIIQSARQSFSNRHTPSKTPEQRSESFKKQGFRYIPSATPNGEQSNPFNVKLKHVPRGSLSKNKNEINPQDISEDSGNSGGEANPYRVTPLSSLDPDYLPREHISFPTTPPIPPQVPPKKIKPKAKIGPPPIPPPDAPLPSSDWSRLGFTPQMSLEEAIRTRRPLKPVNRAPIDTTC